MILRFSTIIVLLMLPLSAYSELTRNDIEAIRSIVKEETTASETRIKEYVDLKVENISLKIEELDKRLNGRIEELDKRLTGRIEELDKGLTGRIDDLNTRFDDLRVTTYAVLGFLAIFLMGILGYIIHTRITIGRLIENLNREIEDRRRSNESLRAIESSANELINKNQEIQNDVVRLINYLEESSPQFQTENN